LWPRQSYLDGIPVFDRIFKPACRL
jgi:hypothetical protein